MSAATSVLQTVHAPTVLGVDDYTPSEAKWLRFKSLKCRDASGRLFEWEFVERVTKYRETDGAGVFAKVVSPGQPDQLLVIAQWRAPIGKFVLELPAGVIEQGESVEAVALRELQEETGYTGRILHITEECTNDQGVCNSSINFAIATVDAAAPENADPQPQPELGETLQVLLLPLDGLAGKLQQLKREQDWAIDSRLLAFAIGLEFCHSPAQQE